MRNETNKFTQFADSENHLHDSHQNHGRKKIALFGYPFRKKTRLSQFNHQWSKNNGHCAGRAGNHTRSSAENRGNQTHHKGGVQTNDRIDFGNKRKGHRFGHESQSNG